MANSYIPRSDTQALAWMKTFSQKIAAQPSRYALSPAEASIIVSAVNAFEAALRAAKDSASRTPVNVCVKDEARNAAQQLCEQYASLIKPNAGISNPDKEAIGVRPVNRARMKINCPQTSPLLSVIACTPGTQTLRFKDSFCEGCGKPFGAMFIEVRVAVADNVVHDVEQARPAGLFTRNPIGIRFTHEEDRKKATYFGRWVSRRGETGPWSAPISMSIAA